jgi:hypothetical protein
VKAMGIGVLITRGFLARGGIQETHTARSRHQLLRMGMLSNKAVEFIIQGHPIKDNPDDEERGRAIKGQE